MDKSATFYEGEMEDIVIEKPISAVELNAKYTIYENGTTYKVERTYNLHELNECMDTFERTCSGEYPLYTLTDDAKKFFGE